MGERQRQRDKQTESTHAQYAHVPKQGESGERFGEGGGNERIVGETGLETEAEIKTHIEAETENKKETETVRVHTHTHNMHTYSEWGGGGGRE